MLSLGTRVICRIDVGDSPRTDPVQLNDGVALYAGEMPHACRHEREGTGAQRLLTVSRRLLAHAEDERTLEYRDVFNRWMIMRRNLVSIGHTDPQRERSFLSGVPLQQGSL